MHHETIDSMNNNCTLVAVREVTRLPDDKIFAVFRAHGYVDNKGLPPSKWLAAAECLGCVLTESNTRAQEPCNFKGADFSTRYRTWGVTLGEFVRRHKAGVYFVIVAHHALVVRNGLVVDHNRRRNLGLRRFVRLAYKVENAPDVRVERTEFLRIPRTGCKNIIGSAAGERWWAAINYLRSNSNVTLSQLLANTSYTRADFTYDHARGHIEYIERGADNVKA